jgi:ribose 5-phosphate isomerase B
MRNVAGSCHAGFEMKQKLIACVRALGYETLDANDMVRSFLGAKFSGEERHVRRIEKVKSLERRFMAEQASL